MERIFGFDVASSILSEHEKNGDVVYKNALMLENLLRFSDHFKMILNFDSGAIYDRSTDIFNRKEDELLTIPTDYYGFSKYLIYKRSMSYDHFFNLRIFNIFHHFFCLIRIIRIIWIMP